MFATTSGKVAVSIVVFAVLLYLAGFFNLHTIHLDLSALAR